MSSAAERLASDPEAVRLLDEALGAWQRRRIAVYCWVAAALLLIGGLDSFWTVATAPAQAPARLSEWSDALINCGLVLAYSFMAIGFSRWRGGRNAMIVAFGWAIVGVGVVCIAGATLVMGFDNELADQPLSPDTKGALAGATALAAIFLLHFLASLFVGLSPREALRPLVPLWIIHAAASLFLLEGSLATRLLVAAAFPLAGGPGVLWSVWTYRRFVERFHSRLVSGRYDAILHDLNKARRLHEALFPPPVVEGPLRLTYAYEPASQIGGDFLFVQRRGPESLLAVVVDVNGHGIAAALAVNRMHEELGRLVENGRTGPAQAIAGLNRFVLRALAPEGVYATAMAVEASVAGGEGRLRWCNAGHPAALLRTGDGQTHALSAVAPLLGVFEADAFAPQDRESPLLPGDVVIAYTDGVTEAEAEARRPFGMEGLRHSVEADGGASQAGELPARVMECVRRHRRGAPADDTLIVALWREP